MFKILKISVAALLILFVCGCEKTVTDEVYQEVIATVPAEEKYDENELKNQITEITDHRSENWSVYVEVPGKDFNMEINNRVVTAASTIKMFNMATLYDEMAKGNIVLDDKLKEYVTDMITISSNDASNEVVKAIGGGSFDIGAQKVTAFANYVGCPDTKEEHMLYNVAPAVSKGRNTTSVKDLASLLRKIYNKECVSKEYDEEMLSLLKNQTWNWKIPKGVPEGIAVANKTGENSKVELDAAIVYSPECDYIICISVTDFQDTDVHPVFIKISERTYNFFNEEAGTQVL